MQLQYRPSLYLLAALLIVTCSIATAKEKERPGSARTEFIPTKGTMQIVPNMLIIKMRENVSFTASGAHTGVGSVDAILTRIGARAVTPLMAPASPLQKRTVSVAEASVRRMMKVAYDASVDPRTLAGELSADPTVEYAEPYYAFPIDKTPNDPGLTQQWAVAMMKLQEAWEVTTGDSTILIGSVDSGVDWSHEDLSNAIYINKGEWGTNGELSNNGVDDDGDGKIDDWHGWDFIGTGTAQAPAPDNNPMDGLIGHGTNTSGCFGAIADNGIGVAGSGWRVKILPIKTGIDGNSLAIIAGYDGLLYAADMNCKIINCSWGGTGAFSQAYQDIIDYAFSKGTLVVASSGNNPIDNDAQPNYPSSFKHVLNVGSIENTGLPSNWATYGTSIAVYAPGAGIYTTKRSGGYVSQTGTSFSCPLVSGVAALVYSQHPTWTPDQVAKQIRVTTDPFQTSPIPKYFGRVNAYKAVSLNKTLADIPGLQIKSFTVTTPTGTRFTQGGQTAKVDIVVENVLAPTSANATAAIEFDNTFVSTPNPTQTIGVLPTFGTKSISFDVVLAANPTTSEGFVPIRIKISDGTYTDYLACSVEIYLDNGWHNTLTNLDVPFFSSIHVKDESVIWASVDITQNSASVMNYVFRTQNGGTQWYFAGQSGVGGYPAAGSGTYCVFGIDALTALIGTGPSSGAASIYRTTNGGQAWTGSSVSSITPFVDAVHMFDAQNGLLIGDPKNGRWGLGKTTDGGVTWTAFTTALTAPGTEAGWNNSYDFIGDNGWFGTNNSKLYKTTNRGETWTALPTPSMHSVDVSFRDLNTGVVRFSKQATSGTDTMAVTTDGGSTWRLVSTIAAQYASVIMERGGKRMWVLRSGNAYESSDLGLTWKVQPVPGGFVNILVTSNYSSSSMSYVYAGGWNVFRYISPAQPVLSAETVPTPMALAIESIYPQPATSALMTTSFRVPSSEQAVLSVYDNTGRLVAHVVEATLGAGQHSAQFDTSTLPAGTYHLRLAAGDRSVTRAFVVVK